MPVGSATGRRSRHRFRSFTKGDLSFPFRKQRSPFNTRTSKNHDLDKTIPKRARPFLPRGQRLKLFRLCPLLLHSSLLSLSLFSLLHLVWRASGNLDSSPGSLRDAPGALESRLMGRTLWHPRESPGAITVTLECSVRPRLRGWQHLKTLKDSHYMYGYAGRRWEGSIECTASSRFVLASPNQVHSIY